MKRAALTLATLVAVFALVAAVAPWWLADLALWTAYAAGGLLFLKIRAALDARSPL